MSIFIGMCSFGPIEKDFNIVLITIDALRADHLSCYGYARNTSPIIDSIAKKGSVFTNVIAPSSWTAPSMVSLLTSVYPINHGVNHGIGYKKGKTIHIQEVFSEELDTLAEILKKQGYTTFGVASNLHLSEEYGFARGFDYFECLPFLAAPSVNEVVYSWKDAIKQSSKYFLWIHYFDPHHYFHARTPWIDDYTPREVTEQLNLSNKTWTDLLKLVPEFKKNQRALSNLIALYDSEINFVDLHLGVLLKNCELEKDTLLIITSDHGEEFLEHNDLGHGKNLYRETTHIPLIIKLPEGSTMRIIDEQVSLLDVMPTILKLLDINPPEHLLGKSLWQQNSWFSRLNETLWKRSTPQYSFSELNLASPLRAIVSKEWKFIYDFKNESEQLYNIQTDPLELNDLANEYIKQSDHLKEQLLRWVSTVKKFPPAKQDIQLTTQEKEKLKGLGYLE